MAEYTIFVRLNGVEVKAHVESFDGAEAADAVGTIIDIVKAIPTTRWQRFILWIKGVKL